MTSDPAETRPDPAADPGPPEPGRQDTGRQETGRPETGQPEMGRPEMGRQDTGRPEKSGPDTGRPEMGRSASGPPVDATALLRMAIWFYGLVVVFAIGYALISGGLGTLLGIEPPTLPGLVGGLSLGIALVLLSRVGARTWPPMLRMSEALADLIGPIQLKHALVLALLSGVAEEVLFRGALWSHLGLIGTTLLFGLVHVLPRRSLWVYPLFATLAGLLFGLLREGTQSLWPCILAHVTVNALNLVWIGSIARRRLAAAAAPTSESATEAPGADATG